MNLAIVGTGLVSPIGLTPLQHACFPRAGLGLHPPSAFVGPDGERVHVLHCPWLGAKLPVADRLAALGEHALRAATESLTQLHDLEPNDTSLFFCLGGTRPGLTEADRQSAVGALTATTPLHRVFTGAASFFEALGAAERLLSSPLGEARVARALWPVDSYISLDAVRAEVEAAPAMWVREPPPPSEAAGAVALMRGTEAREVGMSLGTIHCAGALKGQGADDDDDVVDGAALTALLEHVPPLDGPLVRAYGQTEVDRLRETEWTCAAARNATRFHAQFTTSCVERWTGRVGGAAGAAHFIYGLAAERHHAALGQRAGAGPFVAWAISARRNPRAVRRDGGRSMSMDSSERIRRVEATPKRPGRTAGEVAMLHAPSLVVFSGPCALARRRVPHQPPQTRTKKSPMRS